MQESQLPLVTVAIPVYNAAAFLLETVESVLQQDYQNLEVIIIDNCSTDSSWEIIQAFSDPRITAISNEENIGAEGNWNKCIKQAKGEYFILLPSDDLLYDGSISKREKVLSNDVNQKLAFCFSSRKIINRSGKVIMSISFFETGSVLGQRLIREIFYKGTNVVGEPGSVMVRTDTLRKAGGFSVRIPYVTDLECWVRLLDYGECYCINESLCAFRVSNVNWTSQLGNKRKADFVSFLEEIKQSEKFDIPVMLYYWGIFRANFNEVLRKLFYRFF